MSSARRTQDEIRAAFTRLKGDELIPMASLVPRGKVTMNGVEVHVSRESLERYALMGKRRADGTRIWLDAEKRNGVWYSSAVAIERFLKELSQVEAPIPA